MKSRLITSLMIVVAASGCATDGRSPRELRSLAAAHERTRCESDPAVLAQASQLVTLAREAAGKNDVERAYCYFALLRTIHPESTEAREGFPNAAALFKGLYQQNFYRGRNPESIWETSEPRFMFEWLSSFFVGDEFPRSAVMAIMYDMPMPFASKLTEYVEQTTGPIARWKQTFIFDNGRIDDVEAVSLAPTK